MTSTSPLHLLRANLNRALTYGMSLKNGQPFSFRWSCLLIIRQDDRLAVRGEDSRLHGLMLNAGVR